MVIVVEIEDRCVEKPFLGGWRDVVTGAEYHNAGTQARPENPVDRMTFTEDLDYSLGSTRTANVTTQTLGKIEAESLMVASMFSDRATQTSCLPDLRDKFITPHTRTVTRTTAYQSIQHYRKDSLPILSLQSTIRNPKSDEILVLEDEQRHLSRYVEENC